MLSGKAVMYLYRHPRETQENKAISGRIIQNWARPIFHKEDNFAKLSKEERREKDEAVIAWPGPVPALLQEVHQPGESLPWLQALLELAGVCVANIGPA